MIDYGQRVRFEGSDREEKQMKVRCENCEQDVELPNGTEMFLCLDKVPETVDKDIAYVMSVQRADARGERA
jgi:hypothetical protein